MTEIKKASRPQEAKQANTGSKGNTLLTQKEKIFQYFKEHTATVRMCEQATAIPSQTICGYKIQLLDDEKIIELPKKPCQVTGKKAWYYKSNPEKLPL